MGEQADLLSASARLKKKFDLAKIETGIGYTQIAKMLNVSKEQLSKSLTGTRAKDIELQNATARIYKIEI